MSTADAAPEPRNAPGPAATERPVRTEPNARRVRAFMSGVAIADTTRSIYLFEHGHLPVYYFPIADVRVDLLRASAHRTHCPRKGDAVYWSIEVDGRTIENAVWSYPVPLPGTEDLSQYMAFYWNKIDNWFEEDEEVYVHARDPYTRVDALRSSRHVVVRVDDVTVADTTRPVLLLETGLPTRFYIPKIDVRLDLLRPSQQVTACPYKGTASYYSVALPGRPLLRDLAWVYRNPIPQVPTIENHIAFFNEKVDVVVDGELERRPRTKWS